MKLREFMKDTLNVSKGSVKIPTKGIIEQYHSKYDAMTERLSCKHDIYTVNPGSRKIVHVKVPSEHVDNFFYDVLIEFTPKDKKVIMLEDCDIRIFSNCPSFVFSVAYVFAHWDPDSKKNGKGMMIDSFKIKLPRDRLLIPNAEKKLGEDPIKRKPIIRNPLGLPLFDKSIYYAIFYILDNLDYDKVFHNYHNVSERQVLDSVADFDSLMIRRKQLEKNQRENKAAEHKSVEKDFEQAEKELQKQNGVKTMMKPKSAMRARRISTSGGVKHPRRYGGK